MVTLKDVAKQANVSFSTVSRAINEPDMVNPDTRARIEDAIEKLRYTPHRAARRLRGRAAHAKIFGLLIPDIENPFYSGIVRGVEERAFSEGYAVILSNTNEDPDREQFYLDVLRQEAAAGAILPPFSEGSDRTLDPEVLGFPVVCFDRRPETEDLDTVVVDNEAGAYEAVSHLAELGHRRIGGIVASLGLSTGREREAGYQRALKTHGLARDPDLIQTGDPRQEAGYELAKVLLQRDDPPTALFIGNNVMTMGALVAIRELGLEVPTDLSIASFDDPPWAGLLSPPLTTVRQPTYEIGREAADLLLQRVADPGRAGEVRVLPTELVIRASSAPPAA